MKFIYISQFHDNCGYGSAARGYLKALSNHFSPDDLKIHSVSLERRNSILKDSDVELLDKYSFKDLATAEKFAEEEEYVVVWHMPPPMVTLAEKYAPFDPTWKCIKIMMENGVRNINISAWEATGIPRAWEDIYKNMKTTDVIVPSTWNQEVYSKKIKTHYVPHIMETPQYETIPMDMPVDFENNFVLFSMSQWSHRKGFDSLIRAFCMEFGEQEDAYLIIKTYGVIADSYPVSQEEQARSITNEALNYKNQVQLEYEKSPKCKLVVIPKVLPEEKISWLYENSTAFALLTRGEGFGLTVAEATMLGLPVIVPDSGGHTDYLQEYDNKYLTEGHWTPYFGLPGYSCEISWYEPDIASARSALRQCYNDWKDGKISRKPNPAVSFTKAEVGKKFTTILMEVAHGG